MLLRISAKDGVLALEGELDMATAEELRNRLREEGTGDGPDGPLVLDFTDISFMDSSGLRVLLEAAKERGDEGRLVILHPPQQVQRVLDISIPGGTPGLEVRT
jgi:anti-sigma B factor antagonist